MKLRANTIVLIIAALVLWFLLQGVISLFPSFLWFDNLGFSSVFWKTLSAKALTGFGYGLLFFLILGINFLVISKLSVPGKGRPLKKQINLKKAINSLFGEEAGGDDGFVIDVSSDKAEPAWLSRFWLWGIIGFSVLVGLSSVIQWEVVLKALNGVNFGIIDPIFGKDVGFYVFQLPFQQFLQGFLFTALLVCLAGSIWLYFIRGNLYLEKVQLSFSKGVKAHLAALLALLSLTFAWGLWLGKLEVLYSARGVIFGAGYTDVNAQILAYNLQILVLIVVALMFVLSAFRKNYNFVIAGFGAYVAVALVMGAIYPAVVQNLRVNPNEISLEAPYIKNNIKFTRKAFDIEKVEEKPFAAEDNLSAYDRYRNRPTIDNIRLWDNRPLLKTYNQLQGIRLYYNFPDVDVDRYTIDGNYKQVMLAAREMNAAQLPQEAQTWVNRHLKFTHGFGVCLSPVTLKTPEGLPYFMVKDIPPVTNTNLKIKRPEIYYGEETDDYVIVNSKEKEFDYPKGDKNVYANYQGKGGVQITSFIRRLAFAIKYSHLKILLTGYITSDSRMMFDRDIRKRVHNIAPFLKYDSDPYIVISDKGDLYWILDAYTVSDLYPYSTPSGSGFNQFNYIRNSVKVTINAYDGEVAFYIIDDKDPLVATYQKIFPQMFKDFASMPKDVKKHIRYPYDLFMIQAAKYASYHMTDPQVFYNREDLWNFPSEIYGGSEQKMDAYSIIMRLPEEKNEEFLLMLPFTPNNKDNMIAWMAGRSDMPEYGKLIVYKFPKEKLIYGPRQIEARIDQQTEISQQFTLWGQVGSRVVRGNLLAIPIKQSIVYVEPVYLEASSGALPELKRVIAAYGKNIAMEETLDQALQAVFSGKVSRATRVVMPTTYQTPKAMAKKALQLFDSAKSQLRQGDFGGFGEKFNQLRQVLLQLAK